MISNSIQSCREAIYRDLQQCRCGTCKLFTGIDYDTFCRQAHPDFSPVGWHLGHIAYTEDLWLLQRCAGLKPVFPEYHQLFAADILPKKQRVFLPTLPEVELYLDAVRKKVLDYLEVAPIDEQERLWRFIIQHESQHCETVAFVLQMQKKKEGRHDTDLDTDTGINDREEGRSENSEELNSSEIVPDIVDNILNESAVEEVKIRENKPATSSIPAPILRKKPIPYSQSVFLPIAPIELYFDIEAEPELNLDYLHGVLVVDRYNNTEKFHGFLAESAAEEGAIWEQFLELMWAYPIAPIFHFCDYEVKTFKRLAKLYNTPAYLWKPVLKRFVDIHKQVTQKAIMPVESYALKPIARWLGFDWRDAKANGAQCVCWYDDWLKTGDRSLLEAIVRYNEDDCRATYVVKDWLTNFLLNHEP